MTDRELLTLAATAAGIGIIGPIGRYAAHHSPQHFDGLIVQDSAGRRVRWNPLTSKADAFDLMVALEIDVRNFNGKSHAGKHNQFWCTEAWFLDADPLAATRRAIVRAAAEIGRSKT